MLWMLALLVQDPVKLEPKAQNGDRTTVKITSSVTLEITTKDAEGTKKRVVTLDSGEDFSQEVLLAEAGLVKQAKVRCDRSFRSKSVEGGGGESWTTALQGVNFRVTWTDAIKVETEGEMPVGAETVGAWNAYARLLPKDAVKVGDSWKVEVAAIAPIFWADFENATGELSAKVEKIDTGIATISLAGSIEGSTREGFSAKLTVADTSLVFDVAKGRAVSFTLGGSLSLVRKIVERRPKPGTMNEEIEVVHGEVSVQCPRLNVTVKFE